MKVHLPITVIHLVATAGFVLSVAPLRATVVFDSASQSFSPVLWGPSLSPTDLLQYSFSWTNTSSSPDLRFVNVYSSTTSSWLVENDPIGWQGGSTTSAFNFHANEFTPGAAIQTYISDQPITGFDSAGNPVYATAPHTVSTATAPTSATGVPVALQRNNPNGSPDNGPLGAYASAGSLTQSFGLLGQVVVHAGVPDLSQGNNECVPTATANSVTWLNDTYGYGLGLSTAQIRDILKDAGHMKTNPDGGTSLVNLIDGKNTFAWEKHLPIETHLVDPTFGNIINELSKGQDVELWLDWKNGGAHLITLVGALQIGDAMGFLFNDPDDDINGTRFSPLSSDASGLHMDGLSANTVAFAVAESPIPVPEPAACGLLGSSLLLGAVLSRMRKRSSLSSAPSGQVC